MANFNFNKVIIGGRLTSDPELKTTASGVSVTSFTVAVNRRFGNKNGEEQQADFINVTAWRQQAELVSKYFHKGSSICIVGSLQTRSWTDNNGVKRYATDVVADEVNFVDSKGESSSARSTSYTPAPGAYIPEAYTTSDAPKFEEIADDEELPF
jgi:single-strand DNA-binding protein